MARDSREVDIGAPQQLEILAESLRADEQVAVEATSTALPIARILEPHVARVVIATKRDLEAIALAKAKTDRIGDARAAACCRTARRQLAAR